MEDENGLELSLGLSCGGSSVKPKNKNGSSSDTRAEEVVRNGKLDDDFKSIFDAGSQKPDSVNAAQGMDSSKPEENFFSDLSKAKEENASFNLNGRDFWVGSSNNPVQIEEDKQLETGNKRKMSFSEINHQKKHESDVHHADLHDKARTSNISVADGSAAENEVVVDAEAENSTSGPISRHSDGTKQFFEIGISSDAPKDVHGVAGSKATEFNGEKRLTSSSNKDFKHSNSTYGASFSVQQLNVTNAPCPSRGMESVSVHAPNTQIPGLKHVMPTATGELSGAQPVSNGSFPVMFGYSSVQLPMLDKYNTQGLVSHPQQLHRSFAGRGLPNAAATHVISNNVSKAVSPERSKGDGKQSKQHITEESSSSQPELVKGSIKNLRGKDVSDKSTGEGSNDSAVIKPGLAADVKFGGGGSCPNLPWVSTTGSGPNGKTISGVTYRYSTNQIRIVCACHGSHMIPEEFVRHANEDQAQANLEGSAVLGTVANGNPARS
ncbi:hypothetical protein RJT34_04693 [Clitoria ternatea]|uniref:Ninja-family protein n=1 Tax=Clitoria ternatea TaxID=43366 RepID=A0AAN9KMJ6_CLITE